MKFKTNFNTDFSKIKGQEFKEPSQTVQGDSLTVAELLQHYSSGILDDRTIKQSLYDYLEDQEHDFNDVPNQPISDLTDIDHAKEYIKDVNTRQLQSQKQQQAKTNKKSSEDAPGNKPNEQKNTKQSDKDDSE